jgi:hypothetical protein
MRVKEIQVVRDSLCSFEQNAGVLSETRETCTKHVQHACLALPAKAHIWNGRSVLSPHVRTFASTINQVHCSILILANKPEW